MRTPGNVPWVLDCALGAKSAFLGQAVTIMAASHWQPQGVEILSLLLQQGAAAPSVQGILGWVWVWGLAHAQG